MLPLLFDFALTSSTLPAIIPKVSLGLSPIGTAALMGELFYEHPLVYTLIYIGINGLFPQEQWANIDNRAFYINFQYYPEHIRFLCPRQ